MNTNTTINTNTNLSTLTTVALCAFAALRTGQRRRNSAQARANREVIARINRALDNSAVAVVRALEILFERQTSDEQYSHTTRHDNERGFSQSDARTGSWLVTTVIAQGRAQGRPESQLLRGKALEMGRRIAKNYARTQLLAVAYEKAEAQAQAEKAVQNAYVPAPPSAFGFVPRTLTDEMN